MRLFVSAQLNSKRTALLMAVLCLALVACGKGGKKDDRNLAVEHDEKAFGVSAQEFIQVMNQALDEPIAIPETTVLLPEDGQEAPLLQALIPVDDTISMELLLRPDSGNVYSVKIMASVGEDAQTNRRAIEKLQEYASAALKVTTQKDNRDHVIRGTGLMERHTDGILTGTEEKKEHKDVRVKAIDGLQKENDTVGTVEVSSFFDQVYLLDGVRYSYLNRYRQNSNLQFLIAIAD